MAGWNSIGLDGRLCELAHRAYSTARDSRITVTLIWPGYSSSFSISRAISWLRIVIPSSSIVPGTLDDDGAVLLSHEIAREIEQELEYPGQIKVTVIRESRATDYAR